MDIKLTTEGADRFQRLQTMMDTDTRITDTFTDSDLVELAIDVLAIAAVCDPRMTVSELLNLGLATFQVGNEKGGCLRNKKRPSHRGALSYRCLTHIQPISRYRALPCAPTSFRR